MAPALPTVYLVHSDCPLGKVYPRDHGEDAIQLANAKQYFTEAPCRRLLRVGQRVPALARAERNARIGGQNPGPGVPKWLCQNQHPVTAET